MASNRLIWLARTMGGNNETLAMPSVLFRLFQFLFGLLLAFD
jgi:hypothetical protein